ncbi:MAG: cardiolipin synthase [Candidatus Pseudobacter hemicellulosilyticus]|uniref:Cardiolipin synthase n=1 Tax=Candidatus Pseudobacter hemicellulosilyticus TaxID=3121375 RepID=A0AAJ5WYA2_9BACT|nr:MAG: cardiolipin synthase [Pseudobacter sp.]
MQLTTEIVLLVLAYALMLFTVIRIIFDTVNATKAWSYIILTIFIPVVGSIVYFSLGINYRKRRMYNKKLITDEKTLDALRKDIDESALRLLQTHHADVGNFAGLARLLIRDSLSFLSLNHVTLLTNGEEKFPAVINALEEAQDSIHLQYYIFENDQIGNRIKDILIRKAKEGVKVRFIYDDFGSNGLKKKFIRQLTSAGVEVFPFYKIYFVFLASRLNYRNHRKLIIIDGRKAFTGGINVSDRYINQEDKQQVFWRDAHILVEGPAVLNLQYHFLTDWNFSSGQQLTPDRTLFPVPMRGPDFTMLTQIAVSGPDFPRPDIMLSYFTAIANADRKVYITTPYFIPNNTINDAIKKAALSGCDVRLLVPGYSDSIWVNAASQSYYEALLDCGAKVYLYRKGFVHAKTIIVDDTLSMVGSANIDFRSFDLNFELNTIVYDHQFNAQLTEVFLRDLEDADEIDRNEWRNRSNRRQAFEKVARLLSPLL